MLLLLWKSLSGYYLMKHISYWESGNAPCGAEPAAHWLTDHAGWLTVRLSVPNNPWNGLRISTVSDIQVQAECSCHLGHKCPADLSPRNINIESWLSACMSLRWCAPADRLAERRMRGGEEDRMERGNEGKALKAHNKFSRVGPAKLCAGVILLSAGVIEGHQTIDWTELTSAQFPPCGDMYQPGHWSLYSPA